MENIKYPIPLAEKETLSQARPVLSYYKNYLLPFLNNSCYNTKKSTNLVNLRKEEVL